MPQGRILECAQLSGTHGQRRRQLRSLTQRKTSAMRITMPTALEQVTKEAMDLPARQKLALAEFLLESADAAADPEAESAWDAEIYDRIRAIDEGRVVGVAYGDVMLAAEKRLVP